MGLTEALFPSNLHQKVVECPSPLLLPQTHYLTKICPEMLQSACIQSMAGKGAFQSGKGRELKLFSPNCLFDCLGLSKPGQMKRSKIYSQESVCPCRERSSMGCYSFLLVYLCKRAGSFLLLLLSGTCPLQRQVHGEKPTSLGKQEEKKGHPSPFPCTSEKPHPHLFSVSATSQSLLISLLMDKRITPPEHLCGSPAEPVQSVAPGMSLPSPCSFAPQCPLAPCSPNFLPPLRATTAKLCICCKHSRPTVKSWAGGPRCQTGIGVIRNAGDMAQGC